MSFMDAILAYKMKLLENPNNYLTKIPSSRAEANNKMFFTPAFSRAAVEGPGVTEGHVLTAASRPEAQSRFPLRAQTANLQRAHSNTIARCFPHAQKKQPGPSTSARESFLPKETHRLACAQDDRMVKPETSP